MDSNLFNFNDDANLDIDIEQVIREQLESLEEVAVFHSFCITFRIYKWKKMKFLKMDFCPI